MPNQNETPPKDRMEVTVTDIRMSFLSMVVFMVKWAIASIPALILLFLIFIGVAAVAASLFNPFGGLFSRTNAVSSPDQVQIAIPSAANMADMASPPHAAEKACKEYVESRLGSPASGFQFKNHWDEKTLQGWAEMNNDPKGSTRPFTCYMEKFGSGWKVTTASIE